MTKQPTQKTGRSDKPLPRSEDPVTEHSPVDDNNLVDEASEESFPASDPPAYSTGTATPSTRRNEPDC